LAKLTNLSSEGAGGQEGDSYELQGEEVAHLAKLLGEKISRISELLGKAPARLSKLLGENIKMNAKASFRDARPASSQPRTRIRRAGNKLGKTISYGKRRLRARGCREEKRGSRGRGHGGEGGVTKPTTLEAIVALRHS
jgi:hypothetical protein